MSASNAPPFSHAEADLRALLADMDEFAVRQQASAIGKRFDLTKADILAFWRQERSKASGRSGGGTQLAGTPIGSILKRVEPWPEPVDMGEWLSDCKTQLHRHLAMPDGAYVGLAAWNLYSHVYDRFGYAPYIVHVSPAPECGKTTALRAESQLVRLPLSTGALTSATLFRVVDEHRPTLLCDEQDGRLERNPEMHRLFNEGFHRGGFVLRCVGDDNEPRAFQVFGPKALASIGTLPNTIVSRSIVIQMERSQEPLEELGPNDKPEALARLQRQAARWAQDVGALQIPSLKGFSRRLRDKWGPLLAVGQAAGPKLVERLAKVARDLETAGTEEHLHLELLEDVGRILAGFGWPLEFASESLVRQLNNLEDARWRDERRGDGISPHKVRSLLGHFGIKPEPRALRVGSEEKRGYKTAPIRRAYRIYVEPDTSDGSDTSEGCPGQESGGDLDDEEIW